MNEAKMTNKEVAERLERIADLLQIKGEVIYKILSYRKAAESLTSIGRDINAVRAEGALLEIPGIGKAIAGKIEELLDGGEMEFEKKLLQEVPASLAELLQVPDLGPKKIKLFWNECDIVDLKGLESAAKEGKLRGLAGMGPKSEQKILDGIASMSQRSSRVLLGDAWPAAQALVAELLSVDGVSRVEVAGSLRRRRDTVGDIDILVASENSEPVMERYTGLPSVSRVLGRGEVKSSVEFVDGTRSQVWVHAPERFGTALQYATGSKDHNVKLREIALSKGFSLSDRSLKRLEDDVEIFIANEEEVYERLGLAFVPPELREDRGEVDAAKNGTLPEPLEVGQIIAQLHNHSTWSDGQASVEGMAEAAIARGYHVLAITDHTSSLGITQGVDAEALLRQRDEIDEVQEKLGGRIKLLQGVELEILADGQLDLPDEVLERLDIVVASLHVSLRQPREKITKRLIGAISNPHVDIIGHPTGRLLLKREPADLDMDAVLQAAAETDTALEINANPRRLDLADIYARRAAEMGIKISINTDAHAPEHFDFLEYGVSTARRAWIEPESVINTWPKERLLRWLANRGA
jgi:DNA polymerase (family 10)